MGLKKKFKKTYKKLPKKLDNKELFNFLYWQQYKVLKDAEAAGFCVKIKRIKEDEVTSRYFGIQFTIGDTKYILNDDGSISRPYSFLSLMDTFSLRDTFISWIVPRLKWYSRNYPFIDTIDFKKEIYQLAKDFESFSDSGIIVGDDKLKLIDCFKRLEKHYCRLWT